MVSFDDLLSRKSSVAVVGLGYVGLPLAVALSRHFDVIGFDINTAHWMPSTAAATQPTRLDDAALAASTARFTSDATELGKAGVIIVAVPTPIGQPPHPRSHPVIGAKPPPWAAMPRGCVVCYESTVYPGVCKDELRSPAGKGIGRSFSLDLQVRLLGLLH